MKNSEKSLYAPIQILIACLVAGFAISFPIVATAKPKPNAGRPEKLVEDAAKLERRRLMANVQSWGYQLQKLDLTQLATSPFDLLVIDHAPDRAESVEQMFRPAEVARLKTKADGSRRIALAYMSIGEAERYRFYWNEAWVTQASCPSWLGPVNPKWAGNYPVEYWQPQWQSLIFGSSASYADRILSAGFDGLYLDRADVYEQFKSHPNAKADMETFLLALVRYARTINPAAIVVLQNAEELTRNKVLRAELDGVAKESLYFDADRASIPTSPSERAESLGDLHRAQKAGLKVLAVEYVDDEGKAAIARMQAKADGFLVHLTERSLATLNVDGAERPAVGRVTTDSVTLQSASGDTQLIRGSPCG